MIRAYDDNGNVVDLVEWEAEIRADERKKIAEAILAYITLCEAVKDMLPQLLEIYEKIAEQLKGGAENGTC